MPKRTFNIDGHKVVCQSRSYMRNPNGFWVTVDNRPRVYCNVLAPETAAQIVLNRVLEKEKNNG